MTPGQDEPAIPALLPHGPGHQFVCYWAGPRLVSGQPFTYQILLHPGMGPGGVLGRSTDTAPWSTLAGASPWGPERLLWLPHWAMGHGQRGPQDRPFRGQQLQMTTWSATCRFAELPAPYGGI